MSLAPALARQLLDADRPDPRAFLKSLDNEPHPEGHFVRDVSYTYPWRFRDDCFWAGIQYGRLYIGAAAANLTSPTEILRKMIRKLRADEVIINPGGGFDDAVEELGLEHSRTSGAAVFYRVPRALREAASPRAFLKSLPPKPKIFVRCTWTAGENVDVPVEVVSGAQIRFQPTPPPSGMRQRTWELCLADINDKIMAHSWYQGYVFKVIPNLYWVLYGDLNQALEDAHAQRQRQQQPQEALDPKNFLRPMAKNWQKVLKDHGFKKEHHFWTRPWPDRVWKTDFHVWADFTWRRDDEFPEDDDDWSARIRNRDVNKPDFVRMGISRHAREWEIATPALAAALDELIPAMDHAVAMQNFNNPLHFLAYEVLASVGRKYGRPHNFQEAKKPRARDVIMKLHGPQKTPTVYVTTGPPAPKTIVQVPVVWARDIVMIGSHDHPGVMLRGKTAPPPPQGFSAEQWDYALEIIEYALNEGPDFSGDHEYEGTDIDDYDPEGMLFTPSFTWHYGGGEAAYRRHRDDAYEAPSYRNMD